MNDEPENCFIYCHIPTRKAWPQRERVDLGQLGLMGKMVFLFECPVAWIPTNQEQFEKACEFKGYGCGKTFVWNPELVSFYA